MQNVKQLTPGLFAIFTASVTSSPAFTASFFASTLIVVFSGAAIALSESVSTKISENSMVNARLFFILQSFPFYHFDCLFPRHPAVQRDAGSCC